MSVDHDSAVPLYQQLYELLHDQIERGDIPPGRPIPSKKALVQEHGIAANTVQRAIEMLQADGLLLTVPGKGLYATPREQRRLRD